MRVLVVLGVRRGYPIYKVITTGIAGWAENVSLRRYRHVAMVLLLDLVLTGVFFNIIQDREQAHTQAEFERQADSYVAAIQKGIERNLEIIESIGGLFAANEKVERDDFRRFVQGPLSRHLEIQALSWNERVISSERSQFADNLRQESFTESQSKERRLDVQRVVDIEPPEQIVVTYIEPYESNQAAVGFNVASNPTRLAALERARDTGELATTGRITLEQETGNQYGFLIFKPIYETPTPPGTVNGRRRALQGFAVGVFRVGDMVDAALADLPGAFVNILLIDEASPADEGLLYLGQAPHSDISDDFVNPEEVEKVQLKARSELYLRESLDIPGRQWTLLITPTSYFSAGHPWGSWGVLAGGLLVSALLLTCRITIVNHGAKTQKLAAELATLNKGLKTEISERKRAEEAERRLVEEKVVVDEVARIITSTLDIYQVYDQFATEVKQLVDFDRMSISIWDRHAGVFKIKHTVGQEVPGQDVGVSLLLEGTPTQLAIDTGRAVLLSDTADGQYTTDQRFLKAGLRSMLLVPLTYQGRTIGGIALRSNKVGAYGLKEQGILERLTHQIPPAVANAELFEQSKWAEQEQRRCAEESSVLAEIAKVVAASLDIGQVYEQLGQEIRKLITFDRMLISMVEQGGESVSHAFVMGTEVPGRQHIPLAGTLAEEVIRKRSSIMLDADKEPELREQFPGLLTNFHDGMRSFLAAPLIYRDKVIGVLQLRSKDQRVYSQLQLDLAERVANQITGAIANSRLFAEREKAEEALRDSEKLFRQIADNIQEVIFLVDHENYNVLYINPAVAKFWGRPRESFYQEPTAWIEAIHPDDIQRIIAAFQKQQSTGEFREEYRIIRPDGSIRWIQDYLVPIRNELGQILRLVGIAEDVTDRKQAEDKIIASLEEKEMLLKEINHRVKNNLQIISSLLNLQSREIQDPQALQAFEVTQARIMAMALVHEKLYRSVDLARIDFGDYIRTLATDLGNSYGLSSRDIILKIDAEDILLGVDKAIPCGVIVNELVANSLKHAFPGDRSGEIAISFREFDGQYKMTFKDDGVGFPDGLDISHPTSLGLTIVNALTGQLKGTIEVSRNGGSEIIITFPSN